MSDSKISALPAAAALADADLLALVQGSGASAETRRAGFGQLRAAVHAERALHVRDFGAVGNGVADDTNAIQAALNAAQSAGGGVVLLGPRRYLVDRADLILPSDVSLQGQMDPGGFRLNNDYATLPYALILNPLRSIRLRRNASVESLAVLRKGLASPSGVRSALDAVQAFSGTAIRMGDGTTGASATNGADSAVRRLLILGFEWGIHADGSSRTRVSDVVGDCTNGFYLGRSYDVAQTERVNWHPLVTAGRNFSGTTYPVSGVVNSSGLVRINLPSNHDLRAGDLVVVRGVNGVPGANGRFSVASAPTTSSLVLAGSAFSGAYVSGGTVDPGLTIRRGKAYHLYDADMPNFVNCFEFGHETGWHLDDLCHSAQFANCGVDGGSFDPSSVGVRITGLANRNKWHGGFWSSKSRALVVDVQANDYNMFSGVMLPAGDGRSVDLLDGGLILTGCDVYGQVYLHEAADGCQVVACDAKSASFAGASAAARSRLHLVGTRVAGGADLARLLGGRPEIATFSASGAVETRLSAQSDGAVHLHRRAAGSGAQLRLRDGADAAAATLSMEGANAVLSGANGGAVVVETRSAGGVATERLRLASNGAVTLGGPLTLAADPTAAMQAATRGYVDAQHTERRLTTVGAGGALALTHAAHNGRLVLANPGAGLSLDWNATGHGFTCLVLNRTGADLSVGLANFTAPIQNPDGHLRIRAGGVASLIAYSPDGGATRLCQLSGAGAA